MALLVYYNKIRDDPNEVEYQFGETRNNLDRTLTIDKSTETARSDQPEDGIFRTTAGRIMHRARREKEWPQNGTIAS
ncbi:hypothetical protein [Nocardia cyriacigeorgica]|uniref:Uncharacterized protein n=1 Tax=Nocardia cyriacigeorgica TaxID=135487 RepID=A0A5R8N8S4_9NOCA|nr:hypothetical protein [Nocardia cyriacigeorgica]TLF72101.1 hypothetical protein FEK34_29620 [Nocardia cyriacigeorgica]